MAKLVDILQVERDRQETSTWNVVHLYKTGSFYSAYEWSAWLIAVISFNDAVRMQTKSRQPLAVTRIKMANTEDTFCRVGFPLKSVEKYIPTRTEFEAADDKHLVMSIPMPQPTDGTPVTYERLADAVAKWKESQKLKEPKDARDGNPDADTDHQPAPTPPKPKPTARTATAQCGGGILSQIMAYPLSDRTATQNIHFIQSLKQQLSAIL